MTENPILSVICMAYNEAGYIRRCIESVLMQQTEYAYEFIIHDDASTDGTTEIIHEYASRYPQIIAWCEEENCYSRGISPLPEILGAARGKYIAYCDGDDCWTDPTKLQQQISFLETHPDYGAVYTNYVRYFESTGETKDVSSYISGKSGRVYEETLTRRIPLMISTLLYRKMPPFDIEDKAVAVSDQFRFLAIASESKIHYLPAKMVLYTVRVNSLCHQKDLKRRARLDLVGIRATEYWLKYGPAVSRKTYRETMFFIAKRMMRCAVCADDRQLYMNVEFPLAVVPNIKGFITWLLWHSGRSRILYPMVRHLIIAKQQIMLRIKRYQ